MSNLLTGDFDGVLQVSGATVNRLVAVLHQNAFTNPKLPSFPHSLRLRIGDDQAIDGVRGLVHAQVGVPRVELLHGVSDRFRLEVGVRAWYRPDSGTTPLPAFIHGTVHAEYRLHDIDPACLGWRKLAAEYLWLRVVRESVRFEGTTDEDEPGFAVAGSGAAGATQAQQVARITQQLAALLATRFEATPHKVSPRFRRGALRSLNVPMVGSAVALPLPLGGSSGGQVSSIEHVLLADADLAIGVSTGFVLAQVAPALAALASFTATVNVHVDTPDYQPIPDIDTVYHAGLYPPSVTWKPQGTSAVLEVTVHGWAHTNSVLADATFDVTQEVRLGFDGAAGTLTLAPGSTSVKVHSAGLGANEVADAVKSGVIANLGPLVKNACAQVQPRLDALTSQTDELATQLQTFDEAAQVWLESAEFLPDGFVLRGRIPLSPRTGLVVKTEQTADENGHSALESWIPGGRIDRLEWSWSWANGGNPGKATFTDRFLLRRPPGLRGQWGLAVALSTPLPGLDGWGSVCLRIKGVRVNSVTGQLVPVQSTLRCTRFGFALRTRAEGRRLFLRDMPELSKDVPFPQLAQVWRASTPQPDAAGANTLLFYGGEAARREPLEATLRALEGSGRFDAGLALLVLFREGALARVDRELLAHLQARARGMGLPLLVNEDVRGSWARAFGLRDGEPAWRLLGPEGAVSWSHAGQLEPQRLTEALDTRLVHSAGPAQAVLHSGLGVGARVPVRALQPQAWRASRDVAAHCPPPPPGQLGRGGVVVAFLQKEAAASEVQLRRLYAQHGQAGDGGPLLVLVVDGAEAHEAEALTRKLGLEALAIPDPSGALSDRLGVRVWPTTLTLDRTGTVSDVQTGVAAYPGESAGEYPEPDA